MSLALWRKQQATGLKKCIYSTYSPLSSTHLWLRCSNFFNPSKKNYFVCAANMKIGKAKDLSATLLNKFNCYRNISPMQSDYSWLHKTSTLRQIPVMPQPQHGDAVNADPVFVKTTTAASALCLNETGRRVHVEMTHSSPPIKQIQITSTAHTAAHGPYIRSVPFSMWSVVNEGWKHIHHNRKLD
jgi:hypothetical protein